MRPPRIPHIHLRFGYRALQWSAVLALIALGLMVWGVVVPSPISLVIAMSVGQLCGTLSFAVFLGVVIRDLARRNVFSAQETRFSDSPPTSDDPG